MGEPSQVTCTAPARPPSPNLKAGPCLGQAPCRYRCREVPLAEPFSPRPIVPIARGWEAALKIAKVILAGATALSVVSSAALGQQSQTGIVTKVDRINNIVAIQQTQSGTSGANTGGASQDFKAQAGLALDTVHAGDKVTFSVTETGGVKTITKVQKQ
jgi:hypothetical protein